jgi:hypothetical protein
MFRPKTTLYLLAPALVAVAILTGACGASQPEQQPLQQFFRASGMRDDQTLSNFAAVSFDPKTEGTVTGFTITTVSDVKSEPMQFKALNQAVADAQAADKAFSDKKKAYQDSHADALKRVLAAEAANKKATGADAGVQAEWSKWRDDSNASQKKVSDARAAMQNATPIAEMSLGTPNGPTPDLTAAEGTMESKDVTINATVKAADGSTSQKNLVVTMTRAVTKNPDKTGKWILTAIKPA